MWSSGKSYPKSKALRSLGEFPGRRLIHWAVVRVSRLPYCFNALSVQPHLSKELPVLFNKRFRPDIFLWLFLVFSTSPLLFADILILGNGDRLTGAIEKLAGKKVFLTTLYAGTIQIDWERLDHLSSDQEFEVEVETGRKYQGKVVLNQGKLKVTSGQKTLVFQANLVVAIASKIEVEKKSFLRAVEGNLDVGYNLTRGDSRLNQSSFLAKALIRRQGYKLSGDASSIFSRQDDSQPTSRQTLGARYDWYVNPQIFRFFLGNFEHNDSQRLTFRTVLGGGLGRTLVKNKKTELSLLGGLTFTREQFQGEEGMDKLPVGQSAEGLIGIELKTVLLDRIQFTNKVSTHPNIREMAQYRLEYDSTLRLLLLKNLSWSLSFYDRFVSHPPVDVRRNNYGLISAFGIGF